MCDGVCAVYVPRSDSDITVYSPYKVMSTQCEAMTTQCKECVTVTTQGGEECVTMTSQCEERVIVTTQCTPPVRLCIRITQCTGN